MPVPERLRVLVLGDGAMGQALHGLVNPDHALFQWARDLETWEENAPLETVGADRDVVLFALPAAAHEEQLHRLAPVLSPQCLCLTIAKGLDESARTPLEILESGLPAHCFHGGLYGPLIAAELSAGKPGFAAVGSNGEDALEIARSLFRGSRLRFSPSEDASGIAWCAILKNVYVPLVTVADELEEGDNVRGQLTAAALREIADIVLGFGGLRESVYGEAGLADLVTTLTSESSHHARIGRDLASGRTDRIQAQGTNIRGEGMHTLAVLRRSGRLRVDDYPLMQLMARIVDEPRAAQDIIRSWLP